MAAGWLYDGKVAVRHRVEIAAGDEALLVGPEGDTPAAIASADLLHVETRADAEVFAHREVEGWRLGIERPVPDDIERLLPVRHNYGRWIDRVGLVPAIAILVVVSAAVVFASFQFPAWAAPFVPKSWERKIGNALVGDFGGKFCAGPAGQAALAKLTERLGAPPSDYRVRVVNIPIVNAAALPGGNIVIFNKLIEEAESPDELAGVLGHEISHVEKRHVTQNLIRQLGLGVFISMLGGTVGANADMLMSARYSRRAEGDADDGAREMLARANVSPLPTARFFERVEKEEMSGAVASVTAYIATHPASAGRKAAFRNAAVPGHAYAPALSPSEWQALRGICKDQQAG